MSAKEHEFIGVSLTVTQHKIEAIRAAFANGYFNVCALDGLEDYKYATFAKWVKDCHCKRDLPAETMAKIKAYVVNYFLCPGADSDLDVLALMEEVWPTKPGHTLPATQHPRISLGRLKVFW